MTRFIKLRHFPGALAAGLIVAALPVRAQLPGNGSVSGSYYVRYLGADTSSGSRTFLSFQGIVTFDGSTGADGYGNYTLTGQGVSSGGASASLQYSTAGQYNVASSGELEMQNPFDTSGNTWLYGGMNDGATVIVQSSGTTPYIDFFIAIPVGTAASNASLAGNYYVAGIDFPSGDDRMIRNTFFPVTADGNGGLGTVTVKGTAVNLANAVTAQTSVGATYSLRSDGSGTLNLPAPSGVPAASQLLAGSKTLYISPDGNFFLAGSATSYDLLLGLKAFNGTAAGDSFQGLYFKDALNWDNNPDDYNYGLSNFIGAANEGSGLEVFDEEETDEGGLSYDDTGDQTLTFAADGTQTDSYDYRVVGPDGAILIAAGTGNQGQYGFGIRIKAPTISGSGVFLNPQGVVNATTNAPFTANLAPGEAISLSGSGLAPAPVTASTLPLPTTLGGVQVTINGTPMPLSSVSPTQIQAILPYSWPAGEGIRVINNGVNSNALPFAVGQTAPGVITVPAGGTGDGQILNLRDPNHPTPVTADNPARVGDPVAIFLTGLGDVTPQVPAGSPGPSNPLSMVDDQELAIYIDGQEAPVTQAYLAPGQVGLYQVNVTIPEGVSTGDVDLYVDTVDATTAMATIPIGQ
jgi:uncharacterized protein (TIGR03437 family)